MFAWGDRGRRAWWAGSRRGESGRGEAQTQDRVLCPKAVARHLSYVIKWLIPYFKTARNLQTDMMGGVIQDLIDSFDVPGASKHFDVLSKDILF